MLLKVAACCLSLFSLTAAAQTAPPKEIASVELTDGSRYHLQSLEIYSSAEGDLFWFTDPDGFYRDVSFADIVEMRQADDGWHITMVRTGDQPVRKINNYRFRAVTMTGEDVRFYLKNARWIRFVTVKADKICPLGHIWPNTDFIFCPYDGMELEIRESSEIQVEDRTK